MVDVSSILSKPAADVTPPTPLPTGLYVMQVEKAGEPREIGQNKSFGLDLSVKVLQPIDVDVPPEVELPRGMRLTLWLTENSLFRTVEFLEKTLGIERGQKTIGEMLQEVAGRMFRGEVLEKTYTPKGSDTPQMVNEIGKTYALD